VATADTDQTNPQTANASVHLLYNPKLAITKAVDSVPSRTADVAGDVVNYKITVANTGNISLTGLTVTDQVEAYGVTNATYVSGDTHNAGVLNTDETWVFSAKYTPTQADIYAHSLHDALPIYVATADTDQTNPQTANASVPLVSGP